MSRRELLVFEVAGTPLAVPLSLVEEVVPAGLVTPVPKAPKFLLGLTAVRGKVMGVIDAARRYDLGPALNSHFLVCRVRGNLTAIAIGRPVLAGEVPVRELSAEELGQARAGSGLAERFVKGGYELLDEVEGLAIASGQRCLEVDADLFVSAEMALSTGEA